MDIKYCSQAYLMDLMVRMAHHSTAIEGNTLTLGETKSILIDQIVPKTTTLRELYEVANYKRLMPFLEDETDKPISLSVIQNIHRILLDNIDDRAGQFKRQANMIIGASFIPTAPYLVPSELKNWADTLAYRLTHDQTNEEKVFSIMEQHVRFEHIHPFPDGNGRTGRALMVYSCFEQHIVPIIIEKEQRAEYISLMNDSDARGLADMALALQKKEYERWQLFEQSGM